MGHSLMFCWSCQGGGVGGGGIEERQEGAPTQAESRTRTIMGRSWGQGQGQPHWLPGSCGASSAPPHRSPHLHTPPARLRGSFQSPLHSHPVQDALRLAQSGRPCGRLSQGGTAAQEGRADVRMKVGDVWEFSRKSQKLEAGGSGTGSMLSGRKVPRLAGTLQRSPSPTHGAPPGPGGGS